MREVMIHALHVGVCRGEIDHSQGTTVKRGVRKTAEQCGVRP